MTLKKDPENVSSAKGKLSLPKGIVVFFCLAVLLWAFWLTHRPGLSEPILECSPKESVQQAVARPETTPDAAATLNSVPEPMPVSVPEPAPEPMPEPVRYKIERIEPYIVGDPLSDTIVARTVRQFVAVKYVEDSAVYKYAVDEKWAIAQAGDTVLCTPSLSRGQVEWTQTLEYARPRSK